MRRSRWLVLVAALAFAGCGGSFPPPSQVAPSAGAARSADLWTTYLAAYEGVPLQDDCRPRRVDPSPGTPIRGAVVLYHGFLSCPQQYFELGDRLANLGYRVYLPVLPGHGVTTDRPGKDDLSDLPTTGSWRGAFPAFVDKMNAVLAAETGERIVGGLSLGASVATLANHRAPGLYDRMIVLSPFFGPPGGSFGRGTIALVSRTPLLRLFNVTKLGWHGTCLEKQAQGRAGLCNYRLKHLGALSSFSGVLVRELEEAPLTAPVQVMAVSGDPSISEARLLEFTRIHQDAGTETSACFLPEGLPHSFLSRGDNPGVDMYWLPWVLDVVEAFIARGTAIPTEGVREDGWARCALEGELRDPPPADVGNAPPWEQEIPYSPEM